MPETPDFIAAQASWPTDPELARWADAIRQAVDADQLLVIGGGSTKAFLGLGMSLGHSTLDTRPHDGIVAYEPTELVITAKAGTPLDTLEAALAERGQSLAFEPPRFGRGATLGGMVAAGLSGPSRASVGALRDFVLGVHLLNGRGQHLEFGGQVMKNVAGYDVSRLLSGSMGALGVITQVSLKVLPLAPAEATLRFALSQEEALKQLARWRGQPLPLNASCWLLDTHHCAQGTLYVRLRGAAAAVEAATQMMTRTAGGERLDAPTTALDWTACRDQLLPFFQSPPSNDAALWRLSVAPTTQPLPAVDQPTLVEWHGGLRWVWAPLDAASSLREWACSAGGHATVFRLPASGAADIARFTPLTGPLLAIHQRLKNAFDPAGIFPAGPWHSAH